jgi:hypothetical protein
MKTYLVRDKDGNYTPVDTESSVLDSLESIKEYLNLCTYTTIRDGTFEKSIQSVDLAHTHMSSLRLPTVSVSIHHITSLDRMLARIDNIDEVTNVPYSTSTASECGSSLTEPNFAPSITSSYMKYDALQKMDTLKLIEKIQQIQEIQQQAFGEMSEASKETE